MQQEELKATFDKMAKSYDQQWVKLAPINDSLHLLMGGALSTLPEQAKILCVGAGTGTEIIYLAKRFPQWTFMALDPSASMLDVCRQRLREQGLESRCEFHVGYLESLSASALFDAATSLLVSHFILEKQSRVAFFKSIAERLKPGGVLVSSDLSADSDSTKYQVLLGAWLAMMKEAGVPPEGLENMRNAYERDVAILPEQEVAALIASASFEAPVHFYQVGLVHAWYSVKGIMNT